MNSMEKFEDLDVLPGYRDFQEQYGHFQQVSAVNDIFKYLFVIIKKISTAINQAYIIAFIYKNKFSTFVRNR